MDGLENPSSIAGMNQAQDAHATSSNVPGWSLRLNGCVAGTRQDAASTLKTSGSVEEAASLFIPGNSGCGRNGGRVFVPAIESTRGPKGPRFPFWAGVRACPPAIINGRVGKPVLHCRYESCARCACPLHAAHNSLFGGVRTPERPPVSRITISNKTTCRLQPCAGRACGFPTLCRRWWRCPG